MRYGKLREEKERKDDSQKEKRKRKKRNARLGEATQLNEDKKM